MGSAGDKSTVLVAISMEEEEAELEGDSTIYILWDKVEFKACARLSLSIPAPV